MQYVIDLNYFDNLKPPYPTGELFATIVKVQTRFDRRGKILVNVRSTLDGYIRNIETTDNCRIKNILTVMRVANGDKFIVHKIHDTLYLWIRVGSSPVASEHLLKYRNHMHCPVCDARIHKLGEDVYCINPLCKSTYKQYIKDYLRIATYDNWTDEELNILEDSIKVNHRIKCIPDIYSLIPEEINETSKYKNKLFNGVTIGEYLVNKIAKSMGTITTYNFLNSLNLPRDEQWRLDKEIIDKRYSNIHDFVERLLSSTWMYDTNEFKDCMSSYTHDLLFRFFSNSDAYFMVRYMLDLDIFEESAYEGKGLRVFR